jgi:hypothetical protein
MDCKARLVRVPSVYAPRRDVPEGTHVAMWAPVWEEKMSHLHQTICRDPVPQTCVLQTEGLSTLLHRELLRPTPAAPPVLSVCTPWRRSASANSR